MQRRPAVRVAARRIGACVEQDADEALVVRGARHAQQIVAVRADGGREVGEALELGAQTLDVVGLDGAVGAREGLTRIAQARDVTAQGSPRLEAVAARAVGGSVASKAATAPGVPSWAEASRPCARPS